jgi:hypothetical protein
MKKMQWDVFMEPTISESELALFRFNYENVWKKCVKLIREGKLRVIEDTISFESQTEEGSKNTS